MTAQVAAVMAQTAVVMAVVMVVVAKGLEEEVMAQAVVVMALVMAVRARELVTMAAYSDCRRRTTRNPRAQLGIRHQEESSSTQTPGMCCSTGPEYSRTAGVLEAAT